jgi:hypothetical protein
VRGEWPLDNEWIGNEAAYKALAGAVRIGLKIGADRNAAGIHQDIPSGI